MGLFSSADFRLKNSDFRLPYAASLFESEVLFVYAVIETGGKQYMVKEGDVIYVEKLDVEAGSEYTFEAVKAISAESGFVAGSPVVAGAAVKANVVANGKGKKIDVIKYKPKKNEKKKIGHRQPYTKLQITAIQYNA